jgi:hypothetical protein
VITTSAGRLFFGINELLAGTSELPSTAEFPVIRGHLDLALGEIWNIEFFPFTFYTERRYFRQNWSSASTYNKTNEVYDAATQQYFQCLRDSVTGSGNSPTDSNGDERSAYWAECRTSYAGSDWVTATAYVVGDIIFYPVTNAYYQCHTAHTSSGTLIPTASGGDERWGVLTPFQRYVDHSQSWETNLIGTVFDIKDADPRVTRRWNSLTKRSQLDRTYVVEAMASCWVEFRLRRPRLTGTFYDSTLAYAVGDQVYFTTTAGIGNFYTCTATASAGDTPATDTDKWSIVEIPLAFEGYLIQAAFAKALVGEEDSNRRAQALSAAQDYLVLLLDEHFRQNPAPTISPRTYASTP